MKIKLFLKISVLQILQISVENTCVAGPQTYNFIKKKLQHKHFPVKFLRTPFSTEQLWWLLLKIKNSTQWTHPRKFAIDSTSKFHVESSSKLHQF